MAKPRNKEEIKKIARERIEVLFSEAEQIFQKNKDRANRYVELARKLAMKSNLRMAKKYKRKFCKHCYSYLKHGKNSTTRIRDSKVIIYCKECKKYTRIPIKKLTKNSAK